MSKFILTDCRIYSGGADLSTRSNKATLMAEVEEKDATAFAGGGYTEVLGGLASAKFDGEGQWEAGDAGKVDDVSWSGLGGLGPLTVCPDGADVDDLAWLMYGMRGSYSLGDSVGEVAPWSASLASSWPLARGRIAHPPGTARTATGDGTAVELGAVPAGQYLYAGLHVLSASGTTPSITVAIESDVDALFNGSETTRTTFSAATDRGGQIQRVAGAITDTFWRATWTVSGTTPSFLFVVSLGIK
jgi:hypothetical protein